MEWGILSLGPVGLQLVCLSREVEKKEGFRNEKGFEDGEKNHGNDKNDEA